MIVDEYLEQLQEGWKTWAGIAAALALLIGYDTIKYKQAKKIVEKHRKEIDAQIQRAQKQAVPKLLAIGKNLYRVLNTKYKEYVRHWPKWSVDEMKKWNSPEYYTEKLNSNLNHMALRMARMKRGANYSAFYFNSPPADDVGDSLASDPQFDNDEPLDYTTATGPKYRAWSKKYEEPALAEFRKANKMAEKITMEYVNNIKKILAPYLRG